MPQQDAATACELRVALGRSGSFFVENSLGFPGVMNWSWYPFLILKPVDRSGYLGISLIDRSENDSWWLSLAYPFCQKNGRIRMPWSGPRTRQKYQPKFKAEVAIPCHCTGSLIGVPLADEFAIPKQLVRSISSLMCHHLHSFTYTQSTYPLVIKHCYGKSPFSMGKSTLNGHFQ